MQETSLCSNLFLSEKLQCVKLKKCSKYHPTKRCSFLALLLSHLLSFNIVMGSHGRLQDVLGVPLVCVCLCWSAFGFSAMLVTHEVSHSSQNIKDDNVSYAGGKL